MSKLTKVLIAVGVLVVLGVGVRFAIRGRTGASTEIGGSLEAQPLPEFSSQDPARWVNGAPISLEGAKGQVLFIEGWGPA